MDLRTMSLHEPSPPLLLIRLERAGLRKIIFSVPFMFVLFMVSICIFGLLPQPN